MLVAQTVCRCFRSYWWRSEAYQIGGRNASLTYLLRANKLTCSYDAWGRKLWNMPGIWIAQQAVWSPLLPPSCVLVLASEKPRPAASLSLSHAGRWGGRGEAHHSTGPPTLIRLQVSYGVFYISAIQEHTLAFNCSLAIPPLIKMQLSHFKGRSWISNKN